MLAVDESEALMREFGLLLGAAARLERLAAREFERECGISHPMFEVLLRLEEKDCGDTMGHLAGDLILTSGGMTRLIDRMVKAGLVRRTVSTADRRLQLAELTADGRAALAKAKRVHAATLERVFAGPLDERQREALAEALGRLNATASVALGTLG